MKKYFISLILVLMLFICPIAGYSGTAVGEQSQPVQVSQENNLNPAIDTGLPTVTPQQAEDKAARIVMNMHKSAAKVAPYWTVLIFIIAGFIGIFIREVRTYALGAIIGLVLIVFGPQLIGLFLYFIHS